MRGIGGGGRQHQLGVGGDLEVARAVAGVHNRYAAHLRVVLGGYDHFEDGGDRRVHADELGPIFRKARLEAVGLDAGGLIAGRPHDAAFDVAQKEITAGIIAGEILAPARHGKIVPAAGAGSGSREHHRIAAVRKQVRLRRCFVRGSQAPRFRELHLTDSRCRTDFLSARLGDRDIPRCAFL